jgi:hypothetical protein
MTDIGICYYDVFKCILYLHFISVVIAEEYQRLAFVFPYELEKGFFVVVSGVILADYNRRVGLQKFVTESQVD